MLELTTENYYTAEADKEYMSCSQYQSFCECEAKAWAKLEGRWVEEPGEALKVGNYFHTAMESDEAHEMFCDDNFEDIYKTKVNKQGEVTITGKYAPYEKADVMIRTAKADPLIKSLIDMPGDNEVIMTGKLFGIYWKIRLDKYVKDKRMIIDWKTTADINKLDYNPATKDRETFIETYGYMMRAAIYTEIEKQNANSDVNPAFVIVAISKQDPPDKEALLLNHDMRYAWELEQVQKKVLKFHDIKQGYTKPTRCGQCAYCRATKQLTKIIPYYTLNPQFREGKEVEYERPLLENT